MDDSRKRTPPESDALRPPPYAESIVATVREPLVLLDSALRVVSANPAFYRSFRVTREETEHQGLFELGNRQWNIPELRKALGEVFRSRTALDDFEVTHEFPGIGRRIMLLNARRLMQPEGGAPHILLAIEDVTERRHLEGALQEQREWLDVTLTSIGDAVIATDTQELITFMNTVAEDITGWMTREAVGRPIGEIFRIVSEHTRQPAESPVTRALREGKVVGLANHTLLITRYGTEIPIADSAAPIRGPGGELRGAVIVFRDGTPYRQLEARLRESQKMQAIGTLAGGIAHSFNNLLTIILGYTQLTQGAVPPDSAARHNLEKALAAGFRAKDLVQQILTFGRRTSSDRRPLRLRLLVHETLRLVRATIPTTIDIRVALNTHDDLVLANPTELEQVLVNLASNAEYAMRATGGVLEVTLDAVEVGPAVAQRPLALEPGSYARLTVRDTGPGMSPDVVARVFEPFFTTKPVGQGAGMGLAIAHGVVTAHQGAIAVTSAPGQGTTFSVYLPRIEPAPEPAVPAEPAVPPSGRRERILVVEDEEALAGLAGQVLTDLGYEVTVCTGSLEALETFRRDPRRFDLVMTDQTMPYITGDVLARELQRIRADVPIVLSTGYSPLIDAARARVLGIRAFVMKPWFADGLARTIRAVLDEARPSTPAP